MIRRHEKPRAGGDNDVYGRAGKRDPELLVRLWALRHARYSADGVERNA